MYICMSNLNIDCSAAKGQFWDSQALNGAEVNLMLFRTIQECSGYQWP